MAPAPAKPATAPGKPAPKAADEKKAASAPVKPVAAPAKPAPKAADEKKAAPGPAKPSTCQLRGDKYINCVVFSPDGKILAAGDGSQFDAGSVRLYDPVTGDVKLTLSGQSRR